MRYFVDIIRSVSITNFKYDVSFCSLFINNFFYRRWLRVLFGREFPLQDVLVLWDVILAEGKDFSLAGYILVAMLIVIRTPCMYFFYIIILIFLNFDIFFCVFSIK